MQLNTDDGERCQFTGGSMRRRGDSDPSNHKARSSGGLSAQQQQRSITFSRNIDVHRARLCLRIDCVHRFFFRATFRVTHFGRSERTHSDASHEKHGTKGGFFAFYRSSRIKSFQFFFFFFMQNMTIICTVRTARLYLPVEMDGIPCTS